MASLSRHATSRTGARVRRRAQESERDHSGLVEVAASAVSSSAKDSNPWTERRQNLNFKLKLL